MKIKQEKILKYTITKDDNSGINYYLEVNADSEEVFKAIIANFIKMMYGVYIPLEN